MRLSKDKKSTDKNSYTNFINRSAIGVDINQHAIIMVQLSARSVNQIQLEKYVISKLPKNIIKGNKIQDYEQLVTYLQHSYAQLQTFSQNIVASIPHGLTTIDSIVYNEKETSSDLDSYLQFEVSQTAPLEEMNYDYQITGISTHPVGQRILLVAAKKNDIEPRIELFENADLSLSCMDIDLLAQHNAFSYWINQHATELSEEKIAVIGIHSTNLYAIITQNGQILYKQETSVSAEQLNQLIQRTYQVTEEKAEQMMISAEKPSDYQFLVTDKFNAQVAQEIQRVLQFYYTTQPQEHYADISHILLTGTASYQIGLPEAIFAATNTAASCVNPIVYTTKSNKTDLAKLQLDAPCLTTAFGLALRGL